MKVPDIKGIVSIARGALEAKKPEHAEGKAGAGQAADKVELSGEGHILNKLAAERPDAHARAELVAALKQAYQRGELDLDSEAAAEAMIAEGLFDDLIYGQ